MNEVPQSFKNRNSALPAYATAEMTLLALFSIGMSHKKVLDGQQMLEARIAITYSSAEGRRYQHSADARWNHETAAFPILSSDTKTL